MDRVVFGVVNAVLLRPLEVSEPQNLYELRLKPRQLELSTTSYPAFEDYRRRNTTFSGLAGYEMDIREGDCTGVTR